eukprot:COSAG02_NODE_1108_length_14539_cov_4.353393_14_plen_31_part_00
MITSSFIECTFSDLLTIDGVLQQSCSTQLL